MSYNVSAHHVSGFPEITTTDRQMPLRCPVVDFSIFTELDESISDFSDAWPMFFVIVILCL